MAAPTCNLDVDRQGVATIVLINPPVNALHPKGNFSLSLSLFLGLTIHPQTNFSCLFFYIVSFLSFSSAFVVGLAPRGVPLSQWREGRGHHGIRKELLRWFRHCAVPVSRISWESCVWRKWDPHQSIGRGKISIPSKRFLLLSFSLFLFTSFSSVFTFLVLTSVFLFSFFFF